MTTPHKALLVQALDALRIGEWVSYEDSDHGEQVFCPVCRNAKEYGHYEDCKLEAAIAALQAQIDAPEPEPEPAAWIVEFENGECELHWSDTKESLGETQTPLYTHPPAAREPLTNGEIYTAYITATNQTLRPQDERLALAFTRAIEAAHGIGANP